MSKKIKAYIIGKDRPDLRKLFYNFIERINTSKHSSKSNWDEMSQEDLLWLQSMGYLIDDDIDDYDQVYPLTSTKSSKSNSDVYDSFWKDYEERKKSRKKSRHHNKKKSARIININTPYSGEESEDVNDFDEYDYINTIYYYQDYDDKYTRIEFNSLKEFDRFCSEEGFIVPPDVASDIAYRTCSHVCLNPTAKENGILEISAFEDWASMVYEFTDINELSQ